MLKSTLCDYSDRYILVKRIITVAEETAAAPNHVSKKVIFENCMPFTNCTSRINNTQVDDAHHIDVEIPMYNLIECSDNYSKISGNLWQYYRDEWILADNGDVVLMQITSLVCLIL